MSISPSKRNLGTTWGEENSFWPRPSTHAWSPSWICCCSTDYAVNPAWSELWVICVVDRVEGRMCNCTYLIIYYLPCTLLALCSKWSTDNYLCPEWKFIMFYKTPLDPNQCYHYFVHVPCFNKKTASACTSTFHYCFRVSVAALLWKWYKSCSLSVFQQVSALSLWESQFLCELIFSRLETCANFLVSFYLYRWW